MPPSRRDDTLIAWKTVTYRSVILAIVLALAALLTVFYFMFPGPSKRALAAMGEAVGRLVEKFGGKPAARTVRAGAQEANFTAIDGTVRVKRHNTDNWAEADLHTPLEQGDVVQTGPEGMARIVFADSSNYTIKPDSLIVIEQNSMNQALQTDVSVEVTTGTVDLQTGTYTQGSRSGVKVAGARAVFGSDTAAQVQNNNRTDKHEVMVKKGSGEVVRNGETEKLAEYEKVSFRADDPHMTKTQEMAPPTLIAPANMMPIFSGGEPKQVDFSWSPVSAAKSYHVRVSKNPYFSSTVFDRKVPATAVVGPALREGAYYWAVQAVDDTGRESVESERNRFTVIPKTEQKASIQLELQPFVQHGHVIEVIGKTEPTARVMVNGTEVPVINPDGTFQFFTHPLPNGESMITVTAQNARGAVHTEQKKIVIQ